MDDHTFLDVAEMTNELSDGSQVPSVSPTCTVTAPKPTPTLSCSLTRLEMARVVVVSLFPRFYAAGGRAGVVPYPLDQFTTEAGSRASPVRPVPLGGTLPRYPQEGARGTGLEWQPLSTRYLTTRGEAAHVALRVTPMVSITMMTVI